MIEIIPSIYAATISEAQEKLDLCEGKLAEAHLDIMDGTFVAHESFAASEVRKLKTSCALRAHLMVSDPVGAARCLVGHVTTLFFHVEAVTDLSATLEVLSEHFHVGVVLNVMTPVQTILGHLDHIDSVLIMTVPVGESGAEFDEHPLHKITVLRDLKPDLEIGVDGGVHPDTALVIRKYPIDFVVAGSALFSAEDFDAALESLDHALNDEEQHV